MTKLSTRNASIHLVAAATFFVGTSLCSFSVIIPSYIKAYTGNSFILALVPIIYKVGLCVPQIISVYFFRKYHYRGRAHRNTISDYFILEFIHRITFVLIGISILVFSLDAEGSLAVFFILFAVYNFVCGFSMPIWIDMLTVTIPDRTRTSFMAVREFVGRSVGIAASFSLPFILSLDTFPRNYGWLFLIAGGVLTTGILPILKFKPITQLKADTGDHSSSFISFLEKGFGLIFLNKKLWAILLLSWVLAVSSITYAYYTPYIIDNILSQYSSSLHHRIIAELNIFFLACIAANSILAAKIIPALGYRRTLLLGTACLIVSNIIILCFHTFAAAVIGQYFLAAFMIIIYLVVLNAQMDFTPPEERAVISAIGNTVHAAAVLLFSVIGSLISHAGGYGAALLAVSFFSAILLIIIFFKKTRPAADISAC